MTNYTTKVCILLLVLAALAGGCAKDKFLDIKPNNSLVVPETLDDFQALLDNDTWMNGTYIGGPDPFMGEFSSDNLYVTDYDFEQYPLFLRNLYTWEKDIYETGPVLDWNNPYRVVFYSNVVLDGSAKIKDSQEKEKFNNVTGSALFFRSHAFYQLAQAFAMPYNAPTASRDLGIPLRTTSDVNTPNVRSTIEETYGRILSDVREAARLLPITPKVKTRPSKVAAYGLLSRVYLAMEDYPLALVYADSCLKLKSDLLDYNTLSAQYYPIPMLNEEVIFSSIMQPDPQNWLFPLRIDNVLYASYKDDDLRKSLFYMPSDDGNGYSYWGSYDGSPLPFSGIATDEIYLIKSECLARAGKYTDAMQVLNTLLEKRYVTGTFVPLSATGTNALDLILSERRKELVLRGLRWTDLRRLNKDARLAKEIKHTINGKTFALTPNSLRYTFPIPNNVIALTGIQQNQR